ncbi:hypothetical protein Slin15195_G039820 [Septoria linicola]|uniref:Uncharacterized protein n=1 Tax=Septoria linicola TaxID=215465 RepID=A0A9Q9APB6_9PEZI|nr:hypothetical protein Slin15195_G039820 [Septoria linicola]
MGIPYSKQINAAFEEVTPLVAEGFEVLQTTRNITFLLAEIQVLTVLILFFVLIALCLLLVTCNPDMERERQALVTPILKWLVSWIVSSEGKLRVWLAGLLIVLGGLAVVYGHYWAYFRHQKTASGEDVADQPAESGDGKDVERIREGKASQ